MYQYRIVSIGRSVKDPDVRVLNDTAEGNQNVPLASRPEDYLPAFLERAGKEGWRVITVLPNGAAHPIKDREITFCLLLEKSHSE